MQRLATELRRYGSDNFRIAVANVENAEAAQAVEIRASSDVAIRVQSRVGPFDNRAGTMFIGRFAIFQESGIDVLAKRLDRFARDPFGLGRTNLGLFDQL